MQAVCYQKSDGSVGHILYRKPTPSQGPLLEWLQFLPSGTEKISFVYATLLGFG